MFSSRQTLVRRKWFAAECRQVWSDACRIITTVDGSFQRQHRVSRWRLSTRVIRDQVIRHGHRQQIDIWHPRQSCLQSICNYHTRALRHIRHYLSLPVAQTLACSIVGSRLDYCNSVLFGAPKASIAKLQRAQNMLARVVLNKPRRTPSTELLQSLHWLPVKERIDFKVALLTYKVRHSSTPGYLYNLLSDRIIYSSLTLRSSSKQVLCVPRSRTVCGARAFSIAAPSIWNRLPADVQTSNSVACFKSRLKTFLFRTVYNC